MKKILDRAYEQDEYFKRWLVGLSERTKENYATEIHDWIVFIDMTPTEQIKKRMHDRQPKHSFLERKRCQKELAMFDIAKAWSCESALLTLECCPAW